MTPYASQANWMASLDDSVLLSELTLPGTHDTMAWRKSSFRDISICHEKGLMAQLQCGARFLDLRLCYVRKGRNAANFSLHHGADYQEAYLDSRTDHSANPECTSFVLDDCARFLAFNPSECIVAIIKQENSKAVPSAFGQALQAIFAGWPRSLFYAGEAVPTLGTVRGKIVLVFINELDFKKARTPLFRDQVVINGTPTRRQVSRYGMYWGTLDYDAKQPATETPRTIPVSVENHWKEYETSAKKKYVKANLDAALRDVTGRWFVTYTSASQAASLEDYPKPYAEVMIPWLESYVATKAGRALNHRKLGTVLMDYPSQEVMSRIITFAQTAHRAPNSRTTPKTYSTPWLYDARPGQVDLTLREVEENAIDIPVRSGVKRVEALYDNDYGLVNLRLSDMAGKAIKPWGKSYGSRSRGSGWFSGDFDGTYVHSDLGAQPSAKIDGLQFRYRADRYLIDFRVSRSGKWGPWVCGTKAKKGDFTTTEPVGTRRLDWVATRRQGGKGLVDAQSGYTRLP